MIKIKLSALLDSTAILQKLVNTDLKAKLAWQVARLIKAVDKEIADFNDARMKLIQKYGEKDENDKLITDESGNCKIPDNFISQFSAELNELINTEVEISGNKIRIDELENVNFTPGEINNLEAFIEFDEE